MKNLQKLLIMAFPTLLFSPSFAQEKTALQERSVEPFNSIETSGAIELVLSQGETPWVKVEAEHSDHIKTVVKDQRLIVSQEKQGKRNDKDEKVYINFVTLNGIVLNGLSEVSAENNLSFDSLNIEQTGASEMKLKVTATSLKINISGAGEVHLSGSAKTNSVIISGAGELDANELLTDKTNINISGAGNAKINAKDEISGKISGAGNITYKEEPAVKNIEISGMGSVNGKEDEHASSGEDSTKFKWGKKRIIITDDDEAGSEEDDEDDFNTWAGLDLSVNGMLNKDNSTDLPIGSEFLQLDYPHSLALDLNLFEKDIHLYKNYINLTTGLGFKFSSYGFKKNITLTPDTNYIAAKLSPISDYKKNKLNSIWVTVPVLLELNSRTDRDKCFHVSAGVVFGYKLGSKTKQVYELNGDRKKLINRGDYSLNPLKCDATLRVGYGDYTVFASYGLASIFEKSEGPQLYPFSVGVTLVGF